MAKRQAELVELRGRRLNETRAAVLWYVEELDEDHWFPLSQVEKIEVDSDTQEGSIWITSWLVKQRGIR